MITVLSDLGPCMPFINGIKDDPAYSDPHFSSPEAQKSNLFDAVNKKDHFVLGVTQNDALIGLFSFLILEEERYIEMLIGFSRAYEAYEQIAGYLMENYPGFHVDFVFNPQNDLITGMLEKRGAAFDPEMQKMILTDDSTSFDTDGIERLSEARKDAYIALHTKDCYWTGEKVVEAPDLFKVLLAVDRGEVVGYLDITDYPDENEPFDLFVRETHRRRGWGRKLLMKAIEENRPRKMLLFVEVDNVPAITLYDSMGFTKEEGSSSRLAIWNTPSESE